MKRFSLLAIFIALFATNVYAAERSSVSGFITDETTSDKLMGATVELLAPNARVAQRGYGAPSNKEGFFLIPSVKPGKYVLRVTYIGYKTWTKDVTVDEGKEEKVSIRLIPDPILADAVVVTGIASRNTKSVSDVAVSRIDASNINQRNNYQDFSQMLTGKVAGVQVQTTSGNVGGGITFMVRGGGGLNGNGQPLVFVDGTRISIAQIGTNINGQQATALMDINPDDIANVEILKGPVAAAMYGTSGSNGVVLITTKRGNKGYDFFDVNYKVDAGWNEQSVKYSKDKIVSADVANSIFQKGGVLEHNISFTGKKGLFSYYGGYSTRAEDGIVLNNTFNRESVKATFEANPNEEISLRATGNYVWSENFRPINDNNIMGWMGNTILGAAPWGFTDSNAITLLKNQIFSKRFIGSFEGRYMPNWLPGFYLKGLIGYDGNDYTNYEWYPPGYDYPGIPGIGAKEVFQNGVQRVNIDLSAEYQYNITEELSASTIVGTQLFKTKGRSFDIIMQKFVSPMLQNLGSALDYNAADDSYSEYREAGVFLQQDLRFSDMWFLTLALRNEYASVIGVEAPNIFYPRVSGSVRLDKFGFLPEEINLFKFRAGYGQSGQLPGVLAAQALRWGQNQTSAGTGVVVSSIGNPLIVPERIQEIETGIDIEFINKYGMELTGYYNFANKSIINFPNAPSTGLTATSVPQNVGRIDSWGVEMMLYAAPIQTRDYSLDLNFIFNWSDSKIKDLGGSQPIIGGFNEIGHYEGYTRSAFFDQVVLGAKYDANGKYIGYNLSPEKRFIGYSIPKYNMSFSTSFRFLKNFTLSVMLESSLGHMVSNQTRSFQIQFGNDVEYNELRKKLFGAKDSPALSPSDPEYKIAAERYAKLNPQVKSNFIEEANWLRLREVSLRVNLTDYINDIFGEQTLVKSLNFVASGRNLALWSNYGGIDPQVNFSGAALNVTRGIDFLTLQNPRTFNFAFSIGL